jgi:hypothetical protein
MTTTMAMPKMQDDEDVDNNVPNDDVDVADVGQR